MLCLAEDVLDIIRDEVYLDIRLGPRTKNIHTDDIWGHFVDDMTIHPVNGVKWSIMEAAHHAVRNSTQAGNSLRHVSR
jgi:hypothetical protein